jgi:predicted transcriptional regulator
LPSQQKSPIPGLFCWSFSTVLQCNTPKLEARHEMSATLTIRIDDQLDRTLRDVAAATHRPKGDIVREALRRQLALARFRSLREQLMPLAENQGYLTDEDVFRDIS